MLAANVIVSIKIIISLIALSALALVSSSKVQPDSRSGGVWHTHSFAPPETLENIPVQGDEIALADI